MSNSRISTLAEALFKRPGSKISGRNRKLLRGTLNGQARPTFPNWLVPSSIGFVCGVARARKEHIRVVVMMEVGMTEPQGELLQIADRLSLLTDRVKSPEIRDSLRLLESSANAVAKSWSKSALGYHAYVYYTDFTPPPSAVNFSPEWGLMDRLVNRGDTGWRQYNRDEVERRIHKDAGEVDISHARQFKEQVTRAFDAEKLDLLSILNSALAACKDSFLDAVKDQVGALVILPESEVQNRLTPRGQGWSRDSLAVSQGYYLPPHIRVLAEIRTIQHATETIDKLSDLARKAGSHLSRRQRHRRRQSVVGTNVFIGHGRSLVWRELKDFIEDRLKLPVDEFNRVPVAGVTNIARLSEMLDAAAIGLLIMTGEDEQPDGKLNARMNVVHEAGLFQGRLGFSRAIVVLEDGCEQFSNIEGLGQVRFPKGNIRAAFEEVRQVLEREGVLIVP